MKTPSHTLRSLLDMYKLDAAKYHDAITILANLVSAVAGRPAPPQGLQMGRAANSSIEMLERLLGTLEPLNVPVTKLTIEDAQETLKTDSEMTYFGCGQLLLNISNTLERELRTTKVFVLDPRRSDYYEPAIPLFGQDVDDAYPSSAFDIAEAGKCFALERPTACVMHLMRSLESPLSLLYVDLMGAQPNRSAWGELLKDITHSVNALPNSDARKDKYSEAVAQFRAIKNAWRDVAMHAKQRYTEQEAIDALQACRATLQSLAPSLRE